MSTTLVLEPTRDGERAVIEASFTVYAVFVVLFILIGLPLLLIGLIITLGEGATGEDFGLGLCLGAGGAFMTGSAVLILIRPAQPRRMIFNNDIAALELIEPGRNAARNAFQLPYGEIAGFRVVRHVSTSSSGSRQSTSYRWHVVMDKRDGAAWTLLVEDTEGDGQRALASIVEHVDLDCAPGREHGGQGSGFFDVQSQNGGIAVSWTPPRRLLRALSGLAVTGGVLTGMLGWGVLDPDALAPSILAAIAGVFVLLVLIGAVGSFVRPPHIEITRETMTCSAGGLFFPRTWTAPLSDIHTITFRFAPNEASSHLLALDADQASSLAGLVQGAATPGDAMALLNIMMKAHKIDITSLSTGQALELETILQDHIQAATGKRVA